VEDSKADLDRAAKTLVAFSRLLIEHRPEYLYSGNDESGLKNGITGCSSVYALIAPMGRTDSKITEKVDAA
jgi:hypothetical protein